MTAARATESPTAGARVVAAEADLAVSRMGEMSADLRGCAVLEAASGEVLAASGDPGRWGEAARGLLGAADEAAGELVSAVHVGTEDGEAFAVRRGELAMVAVADRFTLASLILTDMRELLHDLARGEGVPDRRKPHPRELDASGKDGG